MAQISRLFFIGSVGNLLRVGECARLDDEDWTRPVAIVERFLSVANLMSACELPVVNARDFASNDFRSHTSLGGASLLRGLAPRLSNLSQWTRERFLETYSSYQVNVDRKRFDPPEWSTPIKTNVSAFFKAAASSNISQVATGYKTRLEVDLVNQIMMQLSSLLDDFDLKPTVQLAAASGSGTHFHRHEETWLVLLQGVKAWWVASEKPSASVADEAREHTSHPCSWLVNRAPSGLSFCVQQAGEMMYLSAGQFHATCNLADFVLGVGGQGRLPESWSPLYRGVHRGHQSAVGKWLSSSGDRGALQTVNFDPSIEEGSSLLHKAAQKDFPSIALQLLEARADPGEVHEPHRLQPLHHATSQGHVGVSELLIRAKANVNAVSAKREQSDTCYACSPLHSATRNGHDEVISFLVSQNARIDIADGHGDLPLHLAAMSGRTEFAQALIQQGQDVEAASPNGGNLHPLQLAAKTGHADMARLLLSARAQIASRSRDGRTPVHIAASSGHRTVVRLLLNRSAEANARDRYGRFPVHLAAYSGHAPIVEMLEALHGADVDLETFDGSTMLHAATSGNRLEMVNLLLRQRISIDSPDRHGTRALHIAAELGHRAIAKSLLRGGASANVYTQDSEDPLLLAATHGHLQVVQLLLQHGAHLKSGHLHSCESRCSPNIVRHLGRAFTKKATRSASPVLGQTEL